MFKNESRRNLIYTSIGILFILLILVAQSELVNWKTMKNSLPIKEVNASTVHFTGHRAVSREMAFKIANKIIGKKVNGVQVSSQYEVNHEAASEQIVNGKPVWVLPLDYSGFFKWFKQKEIPGYIVVSATNPKSQAVAHFDKKFVLSKNGYFFDNIDRVVKFKSGFKKTYTHF